MIVKKFKTIEQKYKNNIVWGYVNENTGELCLYSKNECIELEKNRYSFFNLYKIYTDNRLHTTFREIVNNRLGLIEKEIYLDKKDNKWYLYNKIIHIGLLTDITLEKIENYENLVFNIINEQVKKKDKAKFYSVMCAENIKIMHNATFIKDVTDIKYRNRLFFKYKYSVKSKLYESVINLIKLVEANSYDTDTIILYILTDNNNKYNKYYNEMKKLLNEKEKLANWDIIVLNVDELNMTDLEKIYD